MPPERDSRTFDAPQDASEGEPDGEGERMETSKPEPRHRAKDAFGPPRTAKERELDAVIRETVRPEFDAADDTVGTGYARRFGHGKDHQK